jgi:cell division protein FtsI (penicillin-binding protein 3)
MSETLRSWRLGVVVGLVVLAFVGLAWRAVGEQLKGAPLYQRVVVDQLVSEGTSVPYRGEIMDRDYETLATSIDVDTAIAEPMSIKDKEGFADSVGSLLGVDPELVYQRIKGDGTYALLKRRISPEESDKVRKAMKEMKGLFLQGVPETVRFYPHLELAGQVIGFVDFNQVGVNGIERRYDDVLRGERKLFFRARGRNGIASRILGDDLGTVVPTAANVVLTIDKDLQSITEKVLAEEVLVNRAEGGMAIVTDVRTGEILAMANYPFVNLNSYDMHEEWVWKNRVVTDVIEPGSTFKPLTYAIALDAGAFSPSEVFNLPYVLAIGRNKVHDAHHKSPLTGQGVLAESSNIGTSIIALRLEKHLFHQKLQGFGIGQRAGINIAGEATGFLSDPDSTDPRFEKWSRFRQASISFGQGVSVSTLQLHFALATLANKGKRMKPLLVKEVLDNQGNVLERAKPEVLAEVVSEKAADATMDAMEEVVGPDGTGGLAYLDFYRVCGKTGTAQIAFRGRYLEDRFNALFYGVFPRWAPQYAITVVIEKPTLRYYGGEVAAPAFKRIAQGLIEERKFYLVHGNEAREKLRAVVAETGSQAAVAAVPEPSEGQGVVPDFRGLNLRESLALANRMRVRLDPVGEGLAVAQSMEPYTEVDELATVTVEYERTF